MDDANRPLRVPFARPDEPRDLGPSGTGDMMRDGYRVLVRRPRVAGYYDLVPEERAQRMEDIVRGFEDMLIEDERY